MSVHCGNCGASLPREALEDDWPGCPRCAETREAREVNSRIAVALEKLVSILEKKLEN